MNIQSIKQGRDGKFAVTIGFGRDLKNLHKVYDQSQLDDLKSIISQAEKDYEQNKLAESEHEDGFFQMPISA